jgi:glycosyltransferase involved in cell wall biosynthesis
VPAVHVVVPDGIDDPARPSGGNVYDRRLCDELATIGWSVREHQLPGRWPRPVPTDIAAFGEVLRRIPDGGLTLIDGLVASSAAEPVMAEATRLRVVVLVHLPFGETTPELAAGEQAMLSGAAAVLTTSEWTRSWLVDRYGLSGDHMQVAVPGVDLADEAPGTPGGGELICVGAVTPAKGYDVLLDALASLASLPWRCTCVGSLALDPAFVTRLRTQAEDVGIAGRVVLTGPLARGDLDSVYASADVLVLASRAETYGMVVTEALARGLPVIATNVGGVPEALGRTVDGDRPGIVVGSGDPDALAAALRLWLVDPDRRQDLRRAAQVRRTTLSSWPDTAAAVARTLAAAGA